MEVERGSPGEPQEVAARVGQPIEGDVCRQARPRRVEALGGSAGGLGGFSRDIARLIAEFSLVDLCRYYRAQGSKGRPRVVVVDEVKTSAKDRKFCISLVLATQTLGSLDKDARDGLFQASRKLFFKPADTEPKSFAQILADATG